MFNEVVLGSNIMAQHNTGSRGEAWCSCCPVGEVGGLSRNEDVPTAISLIL